MRTETNKAAPRETTPSAPVPPTAAPRPKLALLELERRVAPNVAWGE